MSAWRVTVLLMLGSLLLLTGCSREAKPGDIVTIHFTGTLADGKVFETTKGGEPRRVHIGANLILPAFEQALVGMKVREKKVLLLQAEQAFGPYKADPSMIQILEKTSLPHAIDYQISQRLKANITYPDGSTGAREVKIIAIDDKTVTVDANHPLAGKDLNFEIELIQIH